MSDKIYLCDYTLNPKCRGKMGCYYSVSDFRDCFCTKEKKYALKDKNGKPIVFAFDQNEYDKKTNI